MDIRLIFRMIFSIIEVLILSHYLCSYITKDKIKVNQVTFIGGIIGLTITFLFPTGGILYYLPFMFVCLICLTGVEIRKIIVSIILHSSILIFSNLIMIIVSFGINVDLTRFSIIIASCTIIIELLLYSLIKKEFIYATFMDNFK